MSGEGRAERLKQAVWRLNVTASGTTEIDCGMAGFDDDDITKLCQYLGRNIILRSLLLCDNNFSDDGARAIGRAIRVNKALLRLDLRNNLIGDEGADSLVQALKQNKTLTQLDIAGELKISPRRNWASIFCAWNCNNDCHFP